MTNPPTPPGKLYDLEGTRMHIQVEGHGHPAVIFDSFIGGNSLEWANSMSAVSAFTTACAYDRRGYGWSEPAPLHIDRTSDRIVEELRILLCLAGINPPYILCGHSAGATHNLVYAQAYPEEVAGLVLVDPSHPDMFHVSQIPNPDAVARSYGAIASLGKLGLLRFIGPMFLKLLFHDRRVFPPSIWNSLQYFYKRPNEYRTAQREAKAGWVSFSQARGEPGCLGDVPLEILSADWWIKGKPNKMKQAVIPMVQELAAYSRKGKHSFVSDCDHATLPVIRADAVADAVKRIISER